MISWGNGIGSNMELVCERNPNKKVLKKKTQLTVMKNLPCMYTNPDTLTNKMPELKDVIHHNPWIIAVTQIITKNHWIPVQKAALKISNSYNIFSECISTKGRGITIQTHKNLDTQEAPTESECCWISILLCHGCIKRKFLVYRFE